MSHRSSTQRWSLTSDGREHRVEVGRTGLTDEVVWYVDGIEIARKQTIDNRVRLTPSARAGARSPGWVPDLAIRVRLAGGGNVRRVTLYGADGTTGRSARTASRLRLGGVDMVPEPGSYAARREERMRLHPRRHLLLSTLGALASVGLPVLLGMLAVRLVFSVPLPDVPSPDLPAIPWPSIPWPSVSLPDWQLPGWLRRILGVAAYVWPVVLAVVLARMEVNRRRKQDALRAAAAEPRRSDEL